MKLTEEMLKSATEQLEREFAEIRVGAHICLKVDSKDGYCLEIGLRGEVPLFKLHAFLSRFVVGIQEVWIRCDRDAADFMNIRLPGISVARLLPLIEWS